MITIRHERAADIPAREALLDRVFGDARLRKSAERLRQGRLPAQGLSFVAEQQGRIVGTVRLWHVSAGPARPALLLGPLAVDGAQRRQGIGASLMLHAIEAARALGHPAVLLMGDAPYYGRFGFSADKTGALWLSGPYERDRLLVRELVPGALDNCRGLIAASGLCAPASGLDRLTTKPARKRARKLHAA
jgi:predicted N-acetyltransferase YhbS